MARDLIQLYRGNKDNAGPLAQGEVFIETRTGKEEMFVGIPGGEMRIPSENQQSTVAINVKFPPNGLDPATGDGSTDDTDNINAMIALMKANGYTTLYFPKGTYMIRATGDAADGDDGGLRFDFPFRIIMDNETVLEAIVGQKTHSNVIWAKDVDGIEISGGKVIGDRDGNLNTSEFGWCICLRDCQDVYVHDIELTKAHGDCLYLSSTGDNKQNFLVENVIIREPRRWGIAYTAGSHATFRNIGFYDANSSLAFCGGIDFEDQYSHGYFDDILMENCYFENNQNNGDITFQADVSKNVRFINNVHNGSTIGYFISPDDMSNLLIEGNQMTSVNNFVIIDSDVQDNVKIVNNTFRNGDIAITFKGTESEKVIIDGNHFLNVPNGCIYTQVGVSEGLIITNNVMKQCSSALIINGSGHIICGNQIIDPTSSKALTVNFADSIISENILKNCSSDAMYLSAAIDCQVLDNKIENAGRHGIYLLSASSNCIVKGNYVKNPTDNTINAQASSGGTKSFFVYNREEGGTGRTIDVSHTDIVLS